MAAKTNAKPTEAELEILALLWDTPSTVRQVNDRLSVRRNVGYTTTLKQMQIMTEKGLLKRRKAGKLHVYSTAVTKDSTRKFMMEKMLISLFEGSASSLVLHTLGSHKTTKEELLEIRNYLDKLTNKS